MPCTLAAGFPTKRWAEDSTRMLCACPPIYVWCNSLVLILPKASDFVSIVWYWSIVHYLMRKRQCLIHNKFDQNHCVFSGMKTDYGLCFVLSHPSYTKVSLLSWGMGNIYIISDKYNMSLTLIFIYCWIPRMRVLIIRVPDLSWGFISIETDWKLYTTCMHIRLLFSIINETLWLLFN